MRELLEALKAWTHWILAWIFILIILSCFISLLPIGLNDSDLSASKRSGMKILLTIKQGCSI